MPFINALAYFDVVPISSNLLTIENKMLVGYSRVSTDDQNLHLQHDALTQARCKKFFEDQMSGSKIE